LTVPLRVAVVAVIKVAGVVITVGGAARVVKVMSFPLEVPIAFVPLTRK
jgi:hypothetical protein